MAFVLEIITAVLASSTSLGDLLLNNVLLGFRSLIKCSIPVWWYFVPLIVIEIFNCEFRLHSANPPSVEDTHESIFSRPGDVKRALGPF